MSCIFQLFLFIFSCSIHLKNLIDNHVKHINATNHQVDVTIHDNKLKAQVCYLIKILYWTHFYLSSFKVLLQLWIRINRFHEYFCSTLFVFSFCCFCSDWFFYPFRSIDLSYFINPQDQVISFSSLWYLFGLRFSFLVWLNQPLEKLD